MIHYTAYVINMECYNCNRDAKKLILIPTSTPFNAGCSVCRRFLPVKAERYYVYAGFILIHIREW